MKKLNLIVSTLILIQVYSCESPLHKDSGTKSINGTELYYQTVGQGEPIFIIHGGPGLNHQYLLNGLMPLAKDHKLIFYDQRGCGQSYKDLDSTDISLDLFIEDIESLRKEFKIEKLNLLAHSWGGLLGMKYAIKYPGSLNKLILSGSVGASTEIDGKASQLMAERFTEEDNAVRMQIFQSEAFKNREISAIESLMMLGFKQQFYNIDLVDSLKLSLNSDYMKTNELLQFLSKDLSHYNFYSDLEEVKTPTLLLYGSYDPLTNFSGKALNESLSESTMRVINESGHFPFIEQPEEFKKLVNDFLNN